MGALINFSVRHRIAVALVVVVLAVLGTWSATRLPLDAFPDLTNVQVQVVTASPGMNSEEVELLVTVPIERAISGTPGLVELRSLSRTGISSVTAIFESGTDLYFARQLINERLNAALEDIPDSAGRPEMGPPTTGLGEVFQFTLASDITPVHELTRILERDIELRLRAIPGVVEVNAWGAPPPEFHVELDPFALANRGLETEEVATRLREALGRATGGADVQGSEQLLVRGLANPTSTEELAAIVMRGAGADALRLEDVASIRERPALSVGFGSQNGEGQALFVMVQLLAGADARSVAANVRTEMESIMETLPDDLRYEPVYDREKLISSTLHTVERSLVEGGLLVIVVLLLLLGNLRAGLIVASVIPLSMIGALNGLRLFGVSGNLMSLGAIDFGMIVDGTIVVVESIVGMKLAHDGSFGEAVARQTRKMARPVIFAVSILMLVYLPVLLMWGVEGKLFRPMAITVLCALGTALLLTFTWVPALSSWLLKPEGEHRTPITRALEAVYRPLLKATMRHPLISSLIAVAIFTASLVVGSGLGVEFVPRLEEGDIVVQTERPASISPEQALEEAGRIEAILREFPEVVAVASRTGSPAVATDPMGLEQADILVHLAPRDEWVSASSTEELMSVFSARLEREAPGALFNMTQPIEMRFNELLEGITSDVGIKIYGPDHDTLVQLGQQVAEVLHDVQGAADIKAPQVEGVPGVDIVLRAEELNAYGLDAAAVLQSVQLVQRGIETGRVVRGAFQDPVILRFNEALGVPLSEIPVLVPTGGSVPLGELAEVRQSETPARIQREEANRRVVVEANVRGRDLGSFVQQAQRVIREEVELPDGYWLGWSGRYEQLRSAATRTAILLPAVLLAIILMLRATFGRFKPGMLIFLNVPMATTGGIFALALRGLPISMSAVVGFIALFGIAVMNGIVMVSRTRELHQQTGARDAARRSALERFRPVMMTAAVAGIGFVPMALNTGMGAEVQRPLATVVIGGLVTATALTLLILPTIYAVGFRSEDGERSEAS